jgi:hypothetical protein
VIPVFAQLDLTDAAGVVETLRSAAAANRSAACRRGSVDVIGPGVDREPRGERGERLIATGDLHDNPLHLARLVEAAGLGDPARPAAAHLTLHEIIHPDRLVNGMDFSYRALTRVAALKVAFPEHVHTLLANHELAQVLGAGIVKDGVKVVEAFNEGVAYAFGDRAGDVLAAVAEFIRSMPLALVASGARPDTPPSARRGAAGPDDRMEDGPGRDTDPEIGGAAACGAGTVLCAHSLPAPELMDRFDPGVLERDLAEDDYTPRRGSAHLMVWGRGHTPEQLRTLAERWGVGLFVLGHEKAEDGAMTVPPNAVVLNSDHERGVYLPIDLDRPPASVSEALGRVTRLAG